MAGSKRARKHAKPKRVGLRAFAREMGVTLAAVQKAIRDERITRGKDGLIDVEAEKKAWKENSRPRPNGSTGESLAALNRQKLRADLELKLLDLAIRRGEYIHASIVERGCAQQAERTRTLINGILTRWPAHIQQIESLPEGQIRLRPLVTELLNELAGAVPEAEEQAR